MKNVMKVIKALLDALMTAILIIGSIFIFLCVIGITPFVVESGSMEPFIPVGSLCFVNTHVPFEEIKVQDIIAFQLPNGKKVTHRVVRKNNEMLETKGDSNNKPDGVVTKRDNYIGKSIFTIPKVGFFVKSLQTTKGKIILITFIVLLLVASFCISDKRKGRRFKEDSDEKVVKKERRCRKEEE